MIPFLIVAAIVAIPSHFYFKKKALLKAQQQKAEEEKRAREEESRRIALESQRRSNELIREMQEAQAQHEAIEAEIAQNPLSAQYRYFPEKEELKSSMLETDAFLKIAKKQFVAFDLETTGLEAGLDRIAEIAAVRVYHGQIVETFHRLVNPGIPMPPEAGSVNHLTDDMLAGQPKIYNILPDFLDFVGNDVLAAHNARFDAQFLLQDCLRYNFKNPSRFYDTRLLSVFWPGLPDRKLATLLAAASIENSEAHRALGDAEALAKLIIISVEKSSFDYDHDSRCKEDVPIKDHAFAGLRFCFTGDIPGYTRADLERMVKEHDGRMTQRVSSRTNYLVVGAYGNLGSSYVSGKQKAAAEINENGGQLKIITPEAFFSMMHSEEVS